MNLKKICNLFYLQVSLVRSGVHLNPLILPQSFILYSSQSELNHQINNSLQCWFIYNILGNLHYFFDSIGMFFFFLVYRFLDATKIMQNKTNKKEIESSKANMKVFGVFIFIKIFTSSSESLIIYNFLK